MTPSSGLEKLTFFKLSNENKSVSLYHNSLNNLLVLSIFLCMCFAYRKVVNGGIEPSTSVGVPK